MFYAKINTYGSETSRGFVNTWTAYAFPSRKLRDAWIAGQSNITASRCLRREAIKLGGIRNGDHVYITGPAEKPGYDAEWYKII